MEWDFFWSPTASDWSTCHRPSGRWVYIYFYLLHNLIITHPCRAIHICHHLHPSSCLLPAESWISRICAMSSEPPSSLANSGWPNNLASTLQSVNQWRHKEYHVALTPPFRTGFPHSCCQGQTGGLMVWPDRARWYSTHKLLTLLT